MPPSPSDRQRADSVRQEVVRTLCGLAGAADLASYLGLPAHAPVREALVALERKRRQLERLLDDPARAREAELFLESYGLLRDAVERGENAATAPAPDWYAVLGVRPDAPYATIERAWRSAGVADRSREPLVAQAWQVLGNPASRASYDRTRQERTEADNRPPVDDAAPLADDGAEVRAAVGGPDHRDLDLADAALPTSVVVPVTIRGPGTWRGSIRTDHPAATPRPEGAVALAPGRHAVTVRFDPTQIPQRTLTVALNVANATESHTVAFRVRRPDPAARRREWMALGAAAVALVGLGWALGARTAVEPAAPSPDSIGHVAQIPAASACLAAAAPLPPWIDVHVDGLGRTTGVSYGGPTSPEVERCLRDVVLALEFPPRQDGRPAFHRYLVSPTRPGGPP